jgi:hypothetical protein
MKFIPSVGGEYSGAVGGWVASHNRFGQYFRRRSVPVNPSSQYQQTVRAYFAEAVRYWVDILDAGERAAWNTYAANTPVLDKLGQTIYLTGQNMFIRTAIAGQLLGLSIETTAPTYYDLGNFTPLVAVEATTLAQELSVSFNNADEWAATDGGGALIYISRPQNPSVIFHKGPYRLADTIDGNTSSPPSSPAGIAVPFAIVANQHLFSAYRIYQPDGRLSNLMRLGPTLTT